MPSIDASSSLPPKVVGIDFDNTLVQYDQVFHRLALERSLPVDGSGNAKRSLRDHLQREGRNDEWTRLQGIAYGERILEAQPFPGALEFLRRAAAEHVSVYVISHKTEFAALSDRPINLRTAALQWLTRRGVLGPDGLGLPRSNVLFCSTRKEKINEIRRVGCTHFVDDLEETFSENGFPAGVEALLFSPGEPGTPAKRVSRVGSWSEITAHVLGPKRP